MIKKLKRLNKGARIGVFAPGSPANPEFVRLGIENLEQRGFSVSCPLDPASRFGNLGRHFVSADAQERAEVFMNFIEDDSIEAVIAVRGGYGTAEMLPLLDFEKITSARKPVVGYSDVTALLLAILTRSGIPAIHGPTLATEFACEDQDSLASCDFLLELLTNPGLHPSFDMETVVAGEAQGRLVVGNLSMLQTMLGTEWDVDYSGSILLLEEIGEAPYRIHRMLNHLKQVGKFDGLSGVVLGRFSKCESEHGPLVEEILEDFFSELNIPLGRNLQFGHDGLNLAIPLGCQGAMKDGLLELLESPLCELSV